MDPAPTRSTAGVVKRGFTLIEILVVIAIILILIGLIMAAVGRVRSAARWSVSAQRGEEAMRSLRQALDGGGGAAATLHRRLAELAPGRIDGVIEYKNDRRFNVRVPDLGSWIDKPYAPHYFAFPWGREPTDLPGEPTQEPAAGTVVPLESHALSDLTAQFSQELLTIAGILPRNDPASGNDEPALAYRGDRNPARPWNDAWGRPLVLALALYQPQQNQSLPVAEVIKVSGGHAQTKWRIREDLFVRKALDRYGHARAFYLASGAIGPVLRPPLDEAALSDPSADWTSDDVGLLDQLWRQICAVANTEQGGELWRTDGSLTPAVNAFADPPFSGHRRNKLGGQTCQVSVPVEIQ